jgi:hypothetical protein
MQSIMEKKGPMLFEYWKAPTVIEADLVVYHAVGWLLGGMISTTTDLEFLMMRQDHHRLFRISSYGWA